MHQETRLLNHQIRANQEKSEKPISIAPFLWYPQEEQQPDLTITHGKGRKGIIIRTRPVSLTRRAVLFIKSSFRGKA